EEAELLMRRWQRAKRGEGQVVLLAGEPGIGKSRLIATLIERLGPELRTHLRYFCSPHHTESALYPIIQRLERAAGFERSDDAEERLRKLEAVLAQPSASIEDNAIFAELLTLPPREHYPRLNLAPQERRKRTIDAMLRRLEALASQEPML